MSEQQHVHQKYSMLQRIRHTLAYRFSLRHDQAEYADIDTSIRAGSSFKGTNLWVLMLAIFIASIGLNVNSTAVIIGAMLISPLMGPIIGIGYGVSINDFGLVRAAVKNLGIAALIGLITSTLYFLVTPLSGAQSELLARTTPTIWDVLIAMLGGLAGMIAVTRKERSNVIPGVAIATALMPPLCTAGYGIASGSAYYFFGALYLFLINCVFIAVASVLLAAYMHFPHRQFVSTVVERRVHRTIWAVVVLTMLPSVYLAYGMVNAELFRQKANRFIKVEFALENTFVAKHEILPDSQQIEVTLVGATVPSEQLQAIAAKLKNYNLPQAQLITHQGGVSSQDMASLRADLLKDLLSSIQQAVDEKSRRIAELEAQLARVSAAHGDQAQTVRELRAQYPEIQRVVLAQAPVWDADGGTHSNMLIVQLSSQPGLRDEDRKRISTWLKVKMGVQTVRLIADKS